VLLVGLGWTFSYGWQFQTRSFPLNNDTYLVEVVSPREGSRVLSFPTSPTLHQVLEAERVSLLSDPPDIAVENRTKVLVIEQHGGRSEVRLKPMSSATLLGLGQRMNINQMAFRDLTMLPGIGPVTAKRILAARQRQGTFSGVEDLKRIRGVGTETIKKIKTFITFED